MSVFADFQCSWSNPSVIATPQTSLKYFPKPFGPSIVVSNSTPSATNATGQLAVPGNNEVNGFQFHVKLGGTLSTPAAGLITISLQANTATVANPSYTTLATFTANPGNVNPSFPWFMDVVLQGVTTVNTNGSVIVVTTTLHGYYNAFVNNVLANPSTANQVLTNSANSSASGTSSLPPSNVYNFAANPAFGLVATAQFGTGSIGNQVNLYQFQITD
jgi:hypothetical protein